MQLKTEQYALDLPEQLHEPFYQLYFLIKENAPQALEEFKYGVPFFSYKGLLAFISKTPKKDRLYIAFFTPHFKKDNFKLEIFEETKILKKWVFSSQNAFDKDKPILKELLLESLKFKDLKKN